MRSPSKNRRIPGGFNLRRRGAVTVLVALLTVPFLGMVAFAVDIAWIVQSRSDLQNAADAAALAGAEQLMNGFVQYSLPGQTLQSTILTHVGNQRKNLCQELRQLQHGRRNPSLGSTMPISSLASPTRRIISPPPRLTPDFPIRSRSPCGSTVRRTDN